MCQFGPMCMALRPGQLFMIQWPLGPNVAHTSHIPHEMFDFHCQNVIKNLTEGLLCIILSAIN